MIQPAQPLRLPVGERAVQQFAPDAAALQVLIDGEQREAPEALAHEPHRHAGDDALVLGDPGPAGVGHARMVDARQGPCALHLGGHVRVVLEQHPQAEFVDVGRLALAHGPDQHVVRQHPAS